MGVKNFVDYDNADAIIRKIDQKIDSNGAHEILNASGTALTQRSKLQFKGGLSASDDSTNGKTVVSGDYPVFTWDTWIAMTEQEQEAYPDAIITDAPGIDSVLTLDMMTKLWENPDPTTEITTSEMNLSSDDYDMLLIIYKYYVSNNKMISNCTLKGMDARLNVVSDSSSAALVGFRELTRVSDIKYTIGAIVRGPSSAFNSSYIIPYRAYGIKLQHQIDVSAVITPSSSPNHQFAIATTAWVANTGSDATEFPYVANIATTEFSDTFIPARVMLLGADGSDYPTAAEEADIALVDKYIEFSATGVRLRATGTPTNALTLIVAGAVVGTRNMVPVAASDVLLSDNHTVEECLMASNDVPFRFAYDSTSQKYGYIIQNGGADTFVPFKSIELEDVNPNKATTDDPMLYGLWIPQRSTWDQAISLPIQGYSKLSLYAAAYSAPFYYRFGYKDGTFGSQVSLTYSSAGWEDISIPDNANRIQLRYSNTTVSNYERMSYSLEV